ncbi:MAG TPA: DNA mismatch repair endonuclease MutL [Chloroflexota bacterium]|nr:DNA mismatch repair endonuclease MutL [Chloroflexota bacterium]
MTDVALAPRIQVLSPEVVERIAAGEVVERPASVVRELIDNALDAGATTVHVETRGGGLRLIRVTDNGSGIPADQIELAFRHHATSKIREESDLERVVSLGFRGEALPSIAAVSDLSILSAPAGMVGTRLDLAHGAIVRRSHQSRQPGTTVTVRDLFSAHPARLKFIGSPRAESAQISALVRRYALAHPEVSFTLTLDGHASLRTSGLGLEEAFGEIFGASAGSALRPLGPIEREGIELRGFITGPPITRSSRQHITILVNGRCVTSRALSAALEDAYRSLLPRGRHPIALLSLTVPRERVDVNVHPSKESVKVRDEKAIGDVIREAVREQLGRAASLPPPTSFVLGAVQEALPHAVAETGPEWDVVTGSLLRDLQVVGQVRGSLIMAESRTGLYLIDQHRAHERAIYELLRRQQAQGRAGQLLLEPLHIEVTPQQMARLEPRLGELATLGFSCEWFGGHSFLVRSVPVLPETGDLPGMVEDLLDLAADDTDWQHRILASVACRSATKRGRALTPAQCRELVELLAATETPAVCPHGSPIILHFDQRFLERQLDW